MTEKQIELCGIGNGLVDVLLALGEDEFTELNFPKGSMRLVDGDEQALLLKRFADHDQSLVSGGSVANSVVAFSQLGGRGAFITCLGDDRYGLHFQDEFRALEIELGNLPMAHQQTGTALVLVTPDAERTMRVSLGVAAQLAGKDVDEGLIARSRWLFIEGYVFANPFGADAVRTAINFARKHGTRIALTFSEPWVVENFGEPVEEAVHQSDFVFANEFEARAFTGAGSVDAAFAALADVVPGVAVTAGPAGAFLDFGGKRCHVPAFPCEPVDLTGAGDMFAGTLLFGLDRGLELEKTGQAACYMARQVISQVGARLDADPKKLFEAALRAR